MIKNLFQKARISLWFITVFLSCNDLSKAKSDLLYHLIFIPEFHNDPSVYKADSLLFLGQDSLAKMQYLYVLNKNNSSQVKNHIKSKLLNIDTIDQADKYISLINTDSIHILDYLDIAKYQLDHKIEVTALNPLEKIGDSRFSDYYKGISFYFFARYYDERKNDLDSAWHFIMMSKEAFEKTNKITPAYQECLEKVTSFCTYKRKNLLAIWYANEMFEYEKYFPEADHIDKARAYANRAFMMFREGDFDGTDKDIKLGLSLIDPEKSPEIFQNLMKSRLVTSMIKEEDSLWHIAINKIMSNIQPTGKDHIEINRWIGQYYTQSGQYKKAIPYLKMALVAEISKGFVHSARYSTLCFLLSKCYEELRDFDNALDYMAKNVGHKIFKDKSIIKHILTSTEYSFVTALRCANIYFSQYNHARNITSLLHAKNYLDVLDEIMFTQFKVAEENAILQFYFESGQEYFHLGMDVHYELWKKTGEEQYLKSFVQYSDKNKNSLMYRDIQMAQRQINLSTDLIQKEFELRAAIKEEKRKGLQDNRSFNRYIDEYTKLEEEMSAKYKNFITHGLIKETLDLNTVQQNIADDESSILIIDETQDQWYYTLISRKKIIIDRQKITPDKMRSIDTLLASIQKEQIAQKMNADLLPNIIHTSLTKKMMYIPDGIYHRFPLSALLSNKNYDIKHLPSLSMYKKFAAPIQSPKASALFAFSDPETIRSKYRTRLTELPGSYKEVTRLSSQYPNNVTYSGKDATKANFIKAYQDTNVQYIHLALHGLANSIEKDDVKLFFRTSTGGLDSLYGYELLKYKSNCQKIVLSACQSGLGTYEKGEGLFSLPRYFMINGATDVVFNYWDVED